MRNIWAVAKNTVKQAVRMKIAATFILVLLILICVMGITMTGDGTIKGRLQSFLTYSLSLVSLLLSVLTIIIATYSLADDIKQKRIYMVITKPIKRFELLLGKFLGVLLLDAIVLLSAGAIIYSISLYMPRYYKADKLQKRQLKNEIFTARASLMPPVPDVKQEVKELYLKLKKNDQLPEGVSYQKIIKNLTSIKRMEKLAVPVGRQIQWDFKNVKVSENDPNIFVKFKYDVSVNPPDLNVYSLWAVGDLRQMPPISSGPGTTYFVERKDLIRSIREFEVPADAVASDGYLGVAFLNPPVNNTVVIFPTEDGLEVLYKAGSFTSNFARAILVIFAKLIFLAAFGTLAATFLSFPVAILMCFAVFFTSIMSGFVIESLDSLTQNVGLIYNFTVEPFLKLIPRFDYYSPTKYIVPAKLITNTFIIKIFIFMIALKSGIILALAFLIFKFKEIAKITV